MKVKREREVGNEREIGRGMGSCKWKGKWEDKWYGKTEPFFSAFYIFFIGQKSMSRLEL